MTLGEHWEAQAEAWARWAREPGHDAYWRLSGPPLFELLPPPGRRTLDVGSGEGRVARDLKARGHRVVGVDVSPTLVRLAREADPELEVHVADAAALPFPDGSFDLAIAFNSLMDVDDLDTALAEIGRVVEPGGRFAFCVVHPLTFSFLAGRPYLEEWEFDDRVEHGGLAMHFRSRHRTLETYSRALEGGGFAVEALREPPLEAVRGSGVPNFLYGRAVRRR